jgi:hypothetical protein
MARTDWTATTDDQRLARWWCGYGTTRKKELLAEGSRHIYSCIGTRGHDPALPVHVFFRDRLPNLLQTKATRRCGDNPFVLDDDDVSSRSDANANQSIVQRHLKLIIASSNRRLQSFSYSTDLDLLVVLHRETCTPFRGCGVQHGACKFD